MALRITPASTHPTTTHAQNDRLTAPSAPGLPDPLRSSLSTGPTSTTTTALSPHTTPAPLLSTHPLESRLAHWRLTQNNLKMEGLRRTYGIAEPVRRGMELKICREGEWRPAVLGLGAGAGVSGDVLEGRDGSVEWEDVFVGDETREGVDFHSEMEARLKMNW